MNCARGVIALFVLLAVAAVAVVCCATSVDSVGRAVAVDGAATTGTATPVDSCGTIAASGHYVLTSDVVNRSADTCLRVVANDVVLDGRGHVVDGAAFREHTTGVVVTGENVTVRDFATVQWTFGVRYEDAGGVVRNVVTWRTGDGVTVRDSPDVTISGVRATNGFVGVSVYDSDGATVEDSVASDQSSSGVFVADSRDVVVRNVTATRDEVGVAIVGGRGIVLADGRVTGNREVGVLLADTTQNSVVNATLSNPADADDVVLVDATDNRVIGTNGKGWTVHSMDGSRRNDVANGSTAG